MYRDDPSKETGEGVPNRGNNKRKGSEAWHNIACAENYRKSDKNSGSIKWEVVGNNLQRNFWQGPDHADVGMSCKELMFC